MNFSFAAVLQTQQRFSGQLGKNHVYLCVHKNCFKVILEQFYSDNFLNLFYKNNFPKMNDTLKYKKHKQNANNFLNNFEKVFFPIFSNFLQTAGYLSNRQHRKSWQYASSSAYSGRLVALYKAFYTYSTHSMHFFNPLVPRN
jgi:hypothetical protein